MTTKDLRKLGFDDFEILSIIEAVYPEALEEEKVSLPPRRSGTDVQKFLHNFGYNSASIPDIDINIDFLALMGRVNKMVKNPSCPNSIRNNFYKKKHKVINILFSQGRVSEVEEQGNYYLISIDSGKYKFHQLKNTLKINFPVKKGEDYINTGEYEEIDMEIIRKWRLYYCFFRRQLLL